MKPHYIVIADQAHLRIFTERSAAGQSTPTLEEVFAMDFSEARQSYTDNDTDMAGRFQNSKHQMRAQGAPGARTGMSIDERLPLQRETERRHLDDVSREIATFLSLRPEASWDFAAGPTSHNAILERMPPTIRTRLRSSLPKDLVNQPVTELRERFHRAA